MPSTCSSRHLMVVFVLCLLQAAGGLAMPTSTPASMSTSTQWPSLLETARFVVSRWLNETTAIIAIGAIVGLAAASFALRGFDWKDYDEGPSERLMTNEVGQKCEESTKYTEV